MSDTCKNGKRRPACRAAVLLLCAGLLWGPAALFASETAQTDTLGRSAAGQDGFRYPLEVPMSLSGNYGELRSNHFHSGIDFRVGGVVGAPIYAAADGYVSRISVSPTGYGNALYLTHPNGYTTVYGHMLKFADKIRRYVRDRQYESESFVQDIELGPEVFPVKKGEQIGNAGNTGSSGGPHLHFEIRETGSNIPTNVFARGFLSIPDRTAPVFSWIDFFGWEERWGVPYTYRVGGQASGAAYKAAAGFSSGAAGVVELPRYSYVAVDATDRQEGTYAKLAVEEYKVYLDSALVFALKIGEVPIENGRYINSLIEYSQRESAGRSMIKSYVEPGNGLREKTETCNDGLIVLNDTLPHRVRVEIRDAEQNRSVRTFTVRRADSLFTSAITDTLPAGPYMDWRLANVYVREGIEVVIPPLALYRSVYFEADTLPRRVTPYAPVWSLHSGEVPLHKGVRVSMAASVPDSLASKALLVKVGRNGGLSAAGGRYEDGAVSGRITSFGRYTVAVDTDPPVIVPNIKNGEAVKSTVSFIIRDRLSGIASYRAEIDGQWVLAELDAKTSRLSIPLEEARIRKGGRHEVVLIVKDNKDNTAVVKRTFVW